MRRVDLVVTMMVAMVMGIRILVEALLAMEHQEIQAEGIEGRDEDTGQHRERGKAGRWQMAFMNGFDDAVLRIEASEKRCSDQRE